MLVRAFASHAWIDTGRRRFSAGGLSFLRPAFYFTSSNGVTEGLPTRIRLMRRTAIGAPSD
jgi:hypothetical protein